MHWITSGLMCFFLKHCGPVRPQLLILDQHGRHEVLELVDMAMANKIMLFSWTGTIIV